MKAITDLKSVLFRTGWLQALSLTTLILLFVFAVYLPGLSGPYTLDDNSNLLENPSVKITNLSYDSMREAALSIGSGPLRRPVAMLSFALNYYFAGGFSDSTPFKLTNLAIHGLNALLVFWLLFLLFDRARFLASRSSMNSYVAPRQDHIILFSGVLALIWAIHPIQLTSVLYVVQRMTSLSGTFVLLGLISYLIGRARSLSGNKGGLWLVFLGPAFFGFIGVFAKENAALLPLYIIAIESTLYHNETPWKYWSRVDKRYRLIALSGIALLVLFLAILAIQYSLPHYAARPYTVPERLMTEARVILFYISLILVPRINQFGLHHDDISISVSLIDPWTTIPSIIFVAVLAFFAVYYRKRLPFLSLGLLFFFVSHLFESTIFPLDIAYEHRNYLASLGVLLAIAQAFLVAAKYVRPNLLVVSSIAFFSVAGVTTFVRASQWSDYKKLYAFEALHHPDSAILNFELAGFLEQHGKHTDAIEAARRATELNPKKIAFRIFLALLRAKNGSPLDNQNNRAILELLRSEALSPTAHVLLRNIINCLNKDCATLQRPLEQWLKMLIEHNKKYGARARYYHMLGVTQYLQGNWRASVYSMRSSIKIDSAYIPSYLDLVSIFMEKGKFSDAEVILVKLQEIDPKNINLYKEQQLQLSKVRKTFK